MFVNVGRRIIFIAVSVFYFCGVRSMLAQEVVDVGTLNNKVMAGYQGWFNTPGDSNNYGWIHWSRGEIPAANNITFDMWPDIREYDVDELFPTNFLYPNGTNAGLFSSSNPKTVNRHVKWMKNYGIDGVFVQRFISSALARRDQRDRVLQNVRIAAEEHGRVFANMYDLSGCKGSVVEDVKKDWMHLVDDLKITESTRYLQHNRKPLLSIWGLNVGGSKGVLTPEQAFELAWWLTREAPQKYQVTLMAGVDNGWRTDSEAWQKVYNLFDIISPWSVGRYSNIQEADNFRSEYIAADLTETAQRGMQYMPVVFPGFSWANLYPKDGGGLNKIPRNGGTFFWHQFYNVIDAGCSMVYIAMFDEVDEATAIFKIAEHNGQIPTTGSFVTLDIDGYKLPSDWYLQLAGAATKMLRNEISLTSTIPIERFADAKNAVKVYPNPVQNEFTVQLHIEKPTGLEITLYDCMGRFIRDIEESTFLNTGDYSWIESVADLKPALYFIRFEMEPQRLTKVVWITDQ